MSKPSPKPSFSLSSIICSTLGHDYIITRKVTNHIHEYKCTQCGREVTNTYSGHMELLTHQNKRVNAALASFFQKKTRKLSAQ